jgi:hypothetical protein
VAESLDREANIAYAILPELPPVCQLFILSKGKRRAESLLCSQPAAYRELPERTGDL